MTRAWWLLARARAWLILFYLLVVAAASPSLAAHWRGLVLAPFVAAVVAMQTLRPPGARVTAERHPELFALVRDTAARIGAPPPDRIWLAGWPLVAARRPHRNRDLVVGQALLHCLDSVELSALIAHELSILDHRHGWLVGRLYAISSGPTDRRERLAQDLSRFVEAVERRADAAALAAGGGAAGRAFAVANLAGLAHMMFRSSLGVPGRRWFRSAHAVSDIDDGWRRVLEHGQVDVWWDEEEAASRAAAHPGLGAAFGGLTADDVTPRPAKSVRVGPLTRREQRRLARQSLGLVQEGVWWTTFAAAPQKWWIARAANELAPIRKAARIVLGRPAADPAEIAVVLHRRNDEVMRALRSLVSRRSRKLFEEDDPEQLEESDAGALPPPPAVATLIEETLLRRGWRLEHPAVRGILIGPDGERVDANELVKSATDDRGFAHVEALLSEHSTGALADR
jgi:hypothetical protein